MIIRLAQIGQRETIIRETVSAQTLDLDAPGVSFIQPLEFEAHVSRITNAVTVDVLMRGSIRLTCSRCCAVFEEPLDRKIRLSYSVKPSDQSIDISGDIRGEIMLTYPLKPLCSAQCKGLCPRCGTNLNEGGCRCAVTKEKTL